jgi:hypothetical protein
VVGSCVADLREKIGREIAGGVLVPPAVAAAASCAQLFTLRAKRDCCSKASIVPSFQNRTPFLLSTKVFF